MTTTRRQAWRTRSEVRRQVDGDPGTVEAAVAAAAGDRLDVPELVAAEERRQLVWRHVQRLSERCRMLLRVVAFVDRPDYSVVAEALGMPRGSIGPTRGRCLAKLRELLQADPAWGGP